MVLEGSPDYPVNYLVSFNPSGLVSVVRATSLLGNEKYTAKKDGGYVKETWGGSRRGSVEDVEKLPPDVAWLFDHDMGSLVGRLKAGKNFTANNRSDTYGCFALQE